MEREEQRIDYMGDWRNSDSIAEVDDIDIKEWNVRYIMNKKELAKRYI